MRVSAALLQAAQEQPLKAIAMINQFSRSTLAPPPSVLGPGTWVDGASIALNKRILAGNRQFNLLHRGFVACDRYDRGLAAIEELTCPLLFVLGQVDQMTPLKAAQGLIEQARARGQSVQVVSVPVGHHEMAEAPEATLAALRIIRSADGPPLFSAVLENARYLRDGLAALGYAVVEPQPLPAEGAQLDAPGVMGETIVTPIVPVVVGDDWKAVLLWRALWDAGVFVNTALHPAVPPSGALLRTSVMATHSRDDLDRSLEAFASVKGEFESEHGPLPGPGSH
jgi:hypothetical protein